MEQLGKVLTTALSRPLNESHVDHHHGEDREIAALIARLLLHYWATDISASARSSMARDWLEDLREFGTLTVEGACREWRRQPGGKRPTSGDIRYLCIQQQRSNQERAQLAIEERAWPQWLEDVWGPAPEGPQKRAAYLARS